MAKAPNVNQNAQSQRTAQPPQRQQRDRYVFRISWLLVLLCLLGMWYLLSHIQPALSWNAVMDFLNVKVRDRYSMLAVLCLSLVLIVAAVRIISRKEDP